jgi:hypothetical protein
MFAQVKMSSRISPASSGLQLPFLSSSEHLEAAWIVCVNLPERVSLLIMGTWPRSRSNRVMVFSALPISCLIFLS